MSIEKLIVMLAEYSGKGYTARAYQGEVNGLIIEDNDGNQIAVISC